MIRRLAPLLLLAFAGTAAATELPHHALRIRIEPERQTVTVDGVDIDEQTVSPEGTFLTGPWPGIVPGTIFTYRVEISTPPGQIAVAPGRVVERTRDADGNRVVITSEGPVDDLAVFAGPYVPGERKVDGTCTRTWFHPEVAALADLYLERTAAYVAHFTNLIGEPSFRCFSVVSSPLPVGLGFPGLTYVGSSILGQPYMSTTSLAHEVLHGWWGNGVLIEASAGNWAEGLTTLLADHDLAAADDPQAGRQMRERWLRDYTALAAEDDLPARTFRAKRHMRSQTVGYHKTAMTFLMLRDRIGDDAFAGGLQAFWRENQHRRAGWSDLRRAFETSSGTSLADFFAQWIDRAGAPDPHVESATSLREDGRDVLVLEVEQSAPPFAFALPVEIATAAGTITRTVQIDGIRSRARIELPAAPEKVRLDPDFRVFRRLPAASVPPTLRSVTFDPDAELVLLGDDEELHAAGRELAQRLVESKTVFRIPSTTVITARIVIGPPDAVAAARAMHPTEPAPPAVAGTTRIWASRGTDGVDWLWIEAADAASLRAISRRLPHYGSRSYLVFDGTRAVDVGTWPVAAQWIAVDDTGTEENP